MGRVNIGGINVDPSNITGKKLAEIGRWALTGKQIIDDEDETYDKKMGIYGDFIPRKIKARSDVIDYESLKWLDDRIYEVCRKGKL